MLLMNPQTGMMIRDHTKIQMKTIFLILEAAVIVSRGAIGEQVRVELNVKSEGAECSLM